jgi:c-di-GMP-binding flagellar brake protein YcgR
MSEEITDPARIARLLVQLTRRYIPLTVRVAGHKSTFSSCCVGVEKPYVLLDQLMPEEGHQLLLDERKLRVSGKLDGVDIRFSTSLERVDNQNNVMTYYMSMPGMLEYRQRRMAYRVHIPMSMQLRVIIDNGDDGVIEGVLHDLSHGGIGMFFSDTDISADHGVFYECAFELTSDVWLYCSVELRYSKETQARNRQLIGARFVDLRPVQTRLVGRCISELERELLRKRAAY